MFQCYQLPTRVELPKTFVEGVTGTFDPSSFCCLFRRSLVGKGDSQCGGGQVLGENGWFWDDRGYPKLFPGAEEEGIKRVLNPPHEE